MQRNDHGASWLDPRVHEYLDNEVDGAVEYDGLIRAMAQDGVLREQVAQHVAIRDELRKAIVSPPDEMRAALMKSLPVPQQPRNRFLPWLVTALITMLVTVIALLWLAISTRRNATLTTKRPTTTDEAVSRHHGVDTPQDVADATKAATRDERRLTTLSAIQPENRQEAAVTNVSAENDAVPTSAGPDATRDRTFTFGMPDHLRNVHVYGGGGGGSIRRSTLARMDDGASARRTVAHGGTDKPAPDETTISMDAATQAEAEADITDATGMDVAGGGFTPSDRPGVLRQTILQITEDGGRPSNFMVEVRGQVSRSYPDVDLPTSPDPALAIGGWWHASPALWIGGEIGRQRYAQYYQLSPMRTRDPITGDVTTVTTTVDQQATLWWAGISAKYLIGPPMLNDMVQPYVSGLVGGTLLGPMLRSTLGVQISVSRRLAFSGSAEGSSLWYGTSDGTRTTYAFSANLGIVLSW